MAPSVPEAPVGIPLRRVLLWLVLPALTLRLLNLGLCAGDPLLRFPFADGLSYAKWALEISEGDWLGLGRPVFYQAPLFPYMLAILQSVGLGFFPAPQLLNALAGAASVLFAFLIARRLFGEPAAWVAGGILAVFGPLLMYELLPDKVAVGFLMSSASLWALLCLWDRVASVRPGLGRAAFLTGLLCGATAMLRENLLVLVPIAVLLIALQGRRLRARAALTLVAGTLCGLAPSLAHNAIVGGELMPTSYQAATNFWIGNHAEASGTYEALIPGRGDALHEERDAIALAAEGLMVPATDLSPGEVSRYWWGKGLGFLREDFGAWFGLGLLKLQWFLYHAEAPDSVGYEGFTRGRPWFLPARVMMGLVLPLALLGLWLGRRRPEARFVAWLGLMASASVIAFYVVGRYRLACLPFLLPFAAGALVEVLRRPRLVLGALALALPVQVWLHPRGPTGLEQRTQVALVEANRGAALATWTKDGDAALAHFDRAIELVPDFLAARRGISRVLMRPAIRDYERALHHLERAHVLAPSNVEDEHNLGFCLLELGRYDEAEKHLRAVLERAGDAAPVVTRGQLERCRRMRATTEGRTQPPPRPPREGERGSHPGSRPTRRD